MQTERRPAWPTVARDDEFCRALRAFDDDAGFRGVALIGDGGVGKSTLSRVLADSLQSSGKTVRYVLGTQTGGAVPLGAFSRSVDVGAAQQPATMLAAAHKALAQYENLVVVIDDAQLLDPLSATLVYQLAVEASAQLIVIIRSGETVPDAVTALLKERLLRVFHIDPFTRDQTDQLARAVLGGDVEPRLSDELYRRSRGNALLLRGLLNAGRDNGVLVNPGSGWQLRGPLRPDRELHELLVFRLRSLSPEELDVVEVLAVGELLDWEVLREVCDADAVARLEQRGSIQLIADGSDMVAQLIHPVIGEVAIELAGVVRTRQINGKLAQALRAHLEAGDRRSRLPDVRGQIRLAQFMIRSDLEPDLKLIVRAAANAVIMSSLSCGQELARFALDRGGGAPAALVLAEAMSWQGRGEEADAVLAEVQPESDVEVLRVWCLRAANLFWGCGRVDAARHMLAQARNRFGAEAERGLVAALEVCFAFFSGDVLTAIEAGLAMQVPETPTFPTLWVTMALSTSWALAFTGRLDEVRRIAGAEPRAAGLGESRTQRLAVGLVEVIALTASGELAEAECVFERYAALSAGAPGAGAIVTAIRGHVLLARGELAAASQAFGSSMSAALQGFPLGWLMLMAAWAAQVDGARADSDSATRALRACEGASGPQVVVFLPELELARAWQRASLGQTTAAQSHARNAAQMARRARMWMVEMRALHTAVRFGDRSHAARLQELAVTLHNPLADAVALHARGMANRDGDQLDAAADKFVEIGTMALAADAAAQAAREHARRGQRIRTLESSSRAHWLANRCQLQSPSINAAAQPLPITDREREIAMLVAGGMSNREIAEQLSLSVRTVDGHLYRIFAKLGIERRDQLVKLVAGGEPAT